MTYRNRNPLLFLHQRQSPCRTNLDAGWQKAGPLPFHTSVAFAHFPVCIKGGNPIGTRHRTGMAADTSCIIIDNKTSLFILAQAGAGTSHDTGGIVTVLAADRVKV